MKSDLLLMCYCFLSGLYIAQTIDFTQMTIHTTATIFESLHLRDVH